MTPDQSSEYSIPTTPLTAKGYEIVVKSKSNANLRVAPPSASGEISISGDGGINVTKALSGFKGILTPLFGASEEEVMSKDQAPGAALGPPLELETYYSVSSPLESEQEALEFIQSLQEEQSLEAAYLKPPGEPPVVIPTTPTLNTMLPEASPNTSSPNYGQRQDYLGSPPVGVGVAAAHSLLGGKGKDVSIIDCEWGWNFFHEDLQKNISGVAVGVSSSEDNHGTAVIGEIGGDENSFGVKGVSPEANIAAASFVGRGSASVIVEAADRLNEGDILLLEIHRAGPNATGNQQKGYIAVEWWPDDFAAIQYAISRGVVVVEAAGNGWEDLDSAAYSQPSPGFPSHWQNPFDLNSTSSQAILVGAGCPPIGTHGRNLSPWGNPYEDRARCEFSNWGSRIDVQGWGWEVTTTGYGDLQGGDRNKWYTDKFSGTSSASPIIVGVAACLQGILKAQNLPPLTSQQFRTAFRATGSPQRPAPQRPVSQRIGSRPDLAELIDQFT